MKYEVLACEIVKIDVTDVISTSTENVKDGFPPEEIY